MSAFALFYNGRQVSKAHATRLAAIVEAMERKAVITSSSDFPGDGDHSQTLVEGYSIQPVEDRP